jgi:hypothetical protein
MMRHGRGIGIEVSTSHRERFATVVADRTAHKSTPGGGRSLYRAARPRLYAALAFRSSHHASWYASALGRFNRDAVKFHCQ